MATSTRSSILTRALGGTALSSVYGATGYGRRAMTGALIASLLLAPVGASAQQAAVAIDPSQSGAGAPKLDMAPNGTPIVKIAAPSSSGVSRNLYTDFNVDARGLILNNSGQIVSTALGGYIDGNGNLKASGAGSASGPARIILNEVTGASRSMLGGYLEVAGTPAEVVIANPYGISCSGCGFINAPTVTMVAGRAAMDAAGGIAGYRVTDGTIDIGGSGLDASGARLNLFARAIAVNAGIWANRIEGAYGAGEITTAGDEIVVTARGSGSSPAPTVALDVAALGGMYANVIRLIGTEAGLGVNISGTLASLEQGVSLSADGHIAVPGRIVSAGALAVETSGALTVAGTAFADGRTSVHAASVDAAGLIAGTGGVAVTTGAVTGSGTIAAGLKRDGTLGTSGDLSLASSGALTLSGNAIAAGAVRIDAASAAIDGRVQGVGIALTTPGAALIGSAGDVRAQDGVSVRSGSLTQSGVLAGRDVVVATGAFANAGLTAASTTLTVDAGAVTASGALQSEGAFALDADSLAVDGGSLIGLGAGTMAVTVGGDLLITEGEIGSNGALAIRAGSMGVAGEASRITGATGLTVDLAGPLAISSGTVQSGGDARIDAASIGITAGDIRAAGLLDLDAATMTLGADAIAVGGSLHVNGQALSNAGTIAARDAGGSLVLGLTGALTNSGSVQSGGSLSADAASFANSGSLLANGALSAGASASASFINSGTIASASRVTLGAATFIGADGSVEAGGALSLDGGDIDLGDGRYVATGSDALTIAATSDLTANAATIGGNGDVTLSASTLALGGSRVTALGSILLDSGTSLDLGGHGVVAAAGSVTLFGEATVDAAATLIQAGETARFAGSSVILDDSIVEAGGFTFDTTALSLQRAKLRHTGTGDFALTSSGTLDYSGGEIYSAGTNFSIAAGSLVNRGGKILHAASGTLGITVGGSLDNSSGGVIATNGTLDLAAGSLANNGGTITAVRGASIASIGAIVNDEGLIASAGALSLDAASLSNLGGSIEAQGALIASLGTYVGAGGILTAVGTGASLSLDISGTLDGAGLIGSNGNVDVTAGSIALGVTDRITSGAALDMTALGGGGMTLGGAEVDGASVTLKAQAGTLSSGTGGLILAANTLSLDAVTIDLSGSGPASGGAAQGQTVALSGGALVNGGLVNALGDMTIAMTGAVDNRNGGLHSVGALAIGAAGIDNRAGDIVSGAAGLTVNAAGSILNDAGTLGGAGNVTLAAANVDNGAGTIAAAQDLAIDAGALTSAVTGAIWVDRDAVINVSGTLSNRGSIGADRDLTVTADTLDNGLGAGAGVLYATRALSLAYGSGTLGKTIAGDDLALTFAGDFTNAAGQSMISLGSVSLDIGGNFLNEGALEGALGVGIDAGGDITNAAGGTIAGPLVDLSAGGTLTNLGLINGGAQVTLGANSLVNHGRIFGDSVTASAVNSIVNQGSGAVIATRSGSGPGSGSLALRTNGTIENSAGAMIYSLGDIAIGGAGGSGSAASLLNGSATIQAQGDVAIAATSIVNERTSYTLGQTTTTTSADNPPPGGYATTPFPGGVLNSQVTAVTTEDVLTADSGPGKIIAGGNIAIDTAALANRYSTISAGGNLLINGAPGSGGSPVVTNAGLAGIRTRETSTESDVWICLNMSGGSCQDYDTVIQTSGPTTTTEAIVVAPAIISAGGTVAIDAQSIDNLTLTGGTGSGDYSASAGGGTGPLSGSGGALSPGAVNGVAIAGVDPAAIALDPVVVPGLTPATIGLALAPVNGTAPGSGTIFNANLGGLFSFAAAGSNYLVETDPAFAGYGNFLSSDYFLGRLGYDPSRVQRRLGDALYEQQLISNQLVKQTGVARLASYGDNEAQYRALMDAGVVYMQKFSLALGVGLSAEQMATLTTSIVLMVQVEVAGPDGKPVKVLAPRVYLARVDSKDISGAAVIAGNDLRLRSADALTNSGVIRASATSVIDAGSIANRGVIDFGQTGLARTAGDFVSSGVIRGGDLALKIGGDLRLEPLTTTSTVATAWSSGKKYYGTSETTTVLNRASTLTTTGNLAIDVGGLFSIKGSDIKVGGDLAARAAGGIDIASAVDTSASEYSGRSGRTRYLGSDASETNRLSTIDVGGNASLSTPGAFTVKGGEVNADGALSVSAGSIAVSGVTDSADSRYDSVTKKKGLLSSKKTTTHDASHDETVVASTLSGYTVALRSTGDTSILGSNVVASNGVSIAAGGDVTIGALAATDSEEHSVKVKKSGISLSGNGLFAGVAKSATENEATSVTHMGSLVGSAKGDLTIDAGKTLTVTGSQVVGTGTTTLAGESVTIQNVTDTVDTSSLSKSSSFGLSIKAYENVSGAVNSVTGLPGRVGDGAAGGAAQTGITAASETVRSVGAVMGALTNTAGVSANIGFSKSKSTTETRAEIASGSTVSGNNVAIIADTDVAVKGSSVVATNDLSVDVGRDILIESAQNRFESETKSKSAGASVGVNVGVGVGGVSASGNISGSFSKSRGTSEATTQANSSLTAGGMLSLNSGRDAVISGAVAEGRNVDLNVGRDLTVASVQDVASRDSKGMGISAGVSVSPNGNALDVGGNGSVSVSKGTTRSAVVTEQSAIIARGGRLDADVANATTIEGGVIAGVDTAGRDTGKLSLNTDTLQVTDIADAAKSRDISIGVSVSIDDPFERGIAGTNTPVVDGSYTASTFKQETRGTIGQGAITVGDPANSTALSGINRDIDASQVVTKDSQTGFTVYIDEAAIRETVAIATGNAKDSVIVQGIETLGDDPFGMLKDVIAEIQSFSDNLPESGAIEQLTGGIERLIRGKDAVALDQLQAEIDDPRMIGKTLSEAALIKIEDIAARIEQTEGKEAADQFRDEARNNPAVWNYFLGNAQAVRALRSAGDLSDPAIWKSVSLTTPGSVSGVPVDGEILVSSERTVGDMAANTLVGAQNYLTDLEKNNPILHKIMEGGMTLAKGPVGALGSYAMDWAVENAMEKTGLDRKAAELILAVGTRGLAWLSGNSVDQEQGVAEGDEGKEATSLTMAGVTILGITSLGKAIKDYKVKPTGKVTVGDGDNPDIAKANSPAANVDGEAGTGFGARSTFQPDPNIKNVPPSAQRHIIEGEVKPNGSVQGAHYANSTNIRIDHSTVQVDPSGSGVFSAEVSVKKSDGTWAAKSNNQGRATFFPESWSADRILDEVSNASARPPAKDALGRLYYETPSGVKVSIFRDSSGNIKTAYPLWPQ